MKIHGLRLTFCAINSKIQIQNLPDIIHCNNFHDFSSASLDSSVESFTFFLRMTLCVKLRSLAQNDIGDRILLDSQSSWEWHRGGLFWIIKGLRPLRSKVSLSSSEWHPMLSLSPSPCGRVAECKLCAAWCREGHPWCISYFQHP